MLRGGLVALLVLSGAAPAGAGEALAAGAVYGNDPGCAMVASGGYGEDDSWVVVTRRYMRQHESACSFVQTLPDRYGPLFVSAICAGEGENWPATLVVSAGEDGGISVSAADIDPLQLHLCDGLVDAAADKVFGE